MWEALLPPLQAHPKYLSPTAPNSPCNSYKPSNYPSPPASQSHFRPSQLPQTTHKENTQGIQQKFPSHLLYLPERCVNKHGDLRHGHCQGLDDGHSLCPSKRHVCMRMSAPPGAAKGKGTCGCCVSCSQRNSTFLWHLAQRPGAALHPAILILQKEEKNQRSERLSCAFLYCTSQTTHQVTWSSNVARAKQQI